MRGVPLYYRLQCAPDDGSGPAPVRVRAVTETDVRWDLGCYRAGPVPQPLRASVAPHSGTVMPDLILSELPLFSEALLSALRRAGVHNLQVFEAELTDPRDGRVHASYRAVNVVGAVGCADLDASEFDPSYEPPDMSFGRLVLDGARARGLSMFRLAEAVDHVLVSERVGRALAGAALVGVHLSSLEDGVNGR